jgi:hypothetical protein
VNDDVVSALIRTEPRQGHDVFTRRQYLTLQVMMSGASVWMAIEAVSSTALAHPEWDMDEEKTWEEWQAG